MNAHLDLLKGCQGPYKRYGYEGNQDGAIWHGPFHKF